MYDVISAKRKKRLMGRSGGRNDIILSRNYIIIAFVSNSIALYQGIMYSEIKGTEAVKQYAARRRAMRMFCDECLLRAKDLFSF